jgi:hypothetical protein
MSAITPNPLNNNIDTGTPASTADTNGIIGFSASYISLEAVDGIFINGIGSNNSTPMSFPFPNTNNTNQVWPPTGTFVGTVEKANGDFVISGQNGGAVINSGNGGGGNGGENGRGIGSIYITSANGDVVVNCPNGNMESNVGANTTNNNQGNVTNNTQGNQTSYTKGNQSSYTWGNQYSWAQGNQTSIVEDSSNTVIMGGMNQVVVGSSNQDYLGNNFNFTVGAMENITIGLDVETFIGGQIQVNLAYQASYAPFESKETEASIEAIQAKIAAHEALIANIALNILTAESNLNTAGIHIFT